MQCSFTCRGVPPGIGAGVYSSSPWETSFLALTEDAGWKSPYGQFFLKWYSEKLIKCDATSPRFLTILFSGPPGKAHRGRQPVASAFNVLC